MGIVRHLHMHRENHMGARLNARLKTLDIDDVFFEINFQEARVPGEKSWKIHAGDVLSSLSLFRVCRTELH